MCDIEDSHDEFTRPENVREAAIKVKRPAKHKNENDYDYSVTELSDLSNSPGHQKIFVKTWGCAHNNSDSEYMAGQLAEYGYTITEKKEAADLWLLNSCTVKSPAEFHFRNFISQGLESGKRVVVSGCVSQSVPNSDYLQGISIVGVQQIDRIVEVVEETLKGHVVRLLATKKQAGKKLGGAQLHLPKIRKNPLVEILAINTGCLNQCTYCKTKHARGDLGSYSIEELEARVAESFAQGVREVWVTSEDTGAYGRDIGTSLPQLLFRLLQHVPADGCKLRIGMTNPPYMLEHLPEMARILNDSRVYKFLHVPVQSGSDSVLMDMRREYCRADFSHIVHFLKEHVPGISIATDFICGFPTETDEDFRDSLSLIEEFRFPSVFINQFFPRPGTPAAHMAQVPGQTIKSRTKAMSELFHSYLPYAGREGQIYDVLVTDVSFDKRHYVGHNDCYEQVLVPMVEGLLGRTVRVQIVATSKFSMTGTLVDDSLTGWKRTAVGVSLISVASLALLMYGKFRS